MITIWTIAIITLIAGIGGAVGLLLYRKSEKEYRSGYKGIGPIVGAVTSLLIAVLIAGGMLFWLYNTESGARAIKDTQSDFSGGIERTITVYDIDGEIIQQYNGKFDISYDSSRIKFDDENGKRHIIYYTTGTVIIDEE